MDTQPLLRVSSTRPQNRSPATAPDSHGKQFDHHLQDQMQRTETPGESTKSQINRAKSTETATTQTADNEQDEIVQTELTGVETVVAANPEEASSSAEEAEIIINLLAFEDGTTEQELPPDGNMLPPAIAELLLPQDTSPDVKPVFVLTTEIATKTTAVTATLAEQAPVVASQTDVSELIPLTKNEFPAQTLQQITADEFSAKPMMAPDIKLQIKSDEVMSDKQFAALITEANKNTTLSMQQVQAVTGSAAANIQSYIPPQFTAAQSATPAFNGSVNVPVNHPAWGNQLGDQLVFMLQGKMQSAEIKLNPAHLGPMEIRLSVHEDNKASVSFISAHAPVREALDAALPRLRDMMEQQGLDLTHVDVSAHSGGQREAFDQQNHASRANVPGQQDNETVEPATVVRTQIETGLSVFV